MRIAQIQYGSLVDGPGVRTAIWYAGCPIRCPGCYNPQLWSRDSGQEVPVDKVLQWILEGVQSGGDEGVTLVGGEPLAQLRATAVLCRSLAARDIHTIVYTGYELEDMIKRAGQLDDLWTVLHSADVLVDGPFVKELADKECQYRGSGNQRAIDLGATFPDGARALPKTGPVLVSDEWDSCLEIMVDPAGDIHFSTALQETAAALGGDVRPARNCGQSRAEENLVRTRKEMVSDG